MWWLIIGFVVVYVVALLVASHLDDKEKLENSRRIHSIYVDEAEAEIKSKDDRILELERERLELGDKIKDFTRRNEELLDADSRNRGLYYKIVDLENENLDLKDEIEKLKK